MRHTPHILGPAGRRGFTLVELLVAAALCVLVMYVLAEAFRAGTDTLSQLKSVASLAEQLRVAETIIRHDLKQQHLEDSEGLPVLVSDPRVARQSWSSPKRGFFKVVQGSQGVSEGADGNGIPAWRATDHWMQFSNKLSGQSSEDVFISPAPTGVNQEVAGSAANMSDLAPATGFASRWGEITYFLARQPSALMPPEVANPQDLFVLYRRARVLAPSAAPTIVVTPNTIITGNTGYPDLSGFSQTNASGIAEWKMNTSDTITEPQFRLVKNPTIFPQTPPRPLAVGKTVAAQTPFLQPPDPIPNNNAANYGADILLGNVVSFRIQVLNGLSGTPQHMTYVDPGTGTWPAVWDSYLEDDAPARILGIRIELRVYDPRNMVTRQITIDQPL